MPKRIEISGKKYGRLTVRGDGPRKGARRTVVCVCDCGKIVTTDPRSLLSGDTKSCGCYQREAVSLSSSMRGTHRSCGSVEYNTWVKIKGRCFNQENNKFYAYGSRGIVVCDRWKDSFENFLADMGKRPPNCTSIDRIDVNGDYSPENCRWSSAKEQARNKRNHRMVNYRGEKMPLSQACELSGVNYRSALYRLNVGSHWLPSPPEAE